MKHRFTDTTIASGRAWIVIVALGAFAASIRLGRGAVPIDDAFITFRYVENLNAGLGFVYNAGERLLGTSTPLYTLLLALLHRVFSSDLVALSLVINSLADGVSTVLLASVCAKLTHSQVMGVLCGLLWAVCVPSVFYARSGMETSLFVLAMLSAFVCWLEERPVPASGLAAVATLIRPDGIFAVLLVGTACLMYHRSSFLRAVAVSFAVFAPWLLLSTMYFGSPVPHSAIVKTTLDASQRLVFRRVILDLPVTFFLGGAVRQLCGIGAVVCAIAVLAVSGWCFLAGLGKAFAERRASSLFVLCYPVLFAVALLAGNIYAFPWYLVPPLPVLFLGVLAGGFTLRRWLGVLIAVVLLLAHMGAYAVEGNFAVMEQREHERLVLYTKASAVVDAMLDEGGVVAVPEVGIIGYQLRSARILDLAGLVSDLGDPQQSGLHTLTQSRPAFVVGMDHHLAKAMQSPALVGVSYVRVWTLSGASGQTVSVLARDGAGP